jgi:hypothetical protein
MNATLIAAWVGIATGLVAISTFFYSIQQRRKELRWKQAELARKLLDDLFADVDAAQGLYMLDGVRYPYKDFYDQAIEVRTEDVVVTLNKMLATQHLDGKETKILFCLDSLLYFLNRIENSLISGLVLFQDINTPCEYYVALIARHKSVFSQYMLRVGYKSLLYFCERFSTWTTEYK